MGFRFSHKNVVYDLCSDTSQLTSEEAVISFMRSIDKKRKSPDSKKRYPNIEAPSYAKSSRHYSIMGDRSDCAVVDKSMIRYFDKDIADYDIVDDLPDSRWGWPSRGQGGYTDSILNDSEKG